MKLFKVLVLFTLLAAAPLSLQAQEREKLSDDPTKVITKIGFRVTTLSASISGSVALGKVNKINFSISENEEWSFGASHLFKFGIVNVAASQRLVSGNFQNQYSIGSFLPLSAFNIQPAGWQLFAAFGYNYTEGEITVYNDLISDFVQVPMSSDTGYLGMTGLKPLNEKWVIGAGLIGVAGSDDYSGYSIGGGITYNASPRDSFSAFAAYSDNSFGSRDVAGFGYKREF